MTLPSQCPQIEEIKCKRCTHINLVNPNIVHGENGDPFTLHCTYCKAEIESKHERLPDKISIMTNTAFLLNQIFQRADTTESSHLDGLLLKWTRKQHEKSWRNVGKNVKNTKDFVKVTFELSEGSL